MRRNPVDHKGLIRESYRIDGIGDAECRSIFMDWALSLPDGRDIAEALEALVGIYAGQYPDHPMTRILIEAKNGKSEPARRRGGWRARRAPH